MLLWGELGDFEGGGCWYLSMGQVVLVGPFVDEFNMKKAISGLMVLKANLIRLLPTDISERASPAIE